MKFPALVVAFVFTAFFSLHAEPPAPTMPIDQALKLAMDHLADRGLTGQHYISSLTLEDSALTGGERYWLARWSPAIRVDKTVESGLQIKMDGTLARLTSGGPNGTGRPDAVGVRRVGARSIR
jgi:hypothetical protein